jgi:glycine/D-amino acid oxidase-like deaminating enzyme
MNRRAFLEASGAAALGLAIGGCAPRAVATRPYRRPANLVPVDLSWNRVIRTTVGLRPYRESGFVVRADRLDDRTLIHNYGHGGAGMSLSWGTATLAADLAMPHPDRRAAVIGCGIIGLTTARVLQRRGFDVTIYAADLPPDTTSNMSFAGFTPTSGLISPSRHTPEWDEQFRRAVEIAYRQHQLLVGSRYGVSWIDDYAPTNNAPAAGGGRAPGEGTLRPAEMELGREILSEGEHPFATRYARRYATLLFEPAIYLDALMQDVLAFGGRIVVRAFETPRDLVALPETLIVNCTGLGARKLFGDEELTPVKGQLVVLVPQPEVTYALATMLPRRDGIVLGHVMQPGVWSLDVDEAERQRVVEYHLRLFSSMRAPKGGVVATGLRSPMQAPPVESFFSRES